MIKCGTFFSDWTLEDVEKHNARIKNSTPKTETKIKDDKLISEKQKSKYKAIKTVQDGIEFDSKKEAERYSELKLLEKAGRIEDIQLQVKFELQPAFEFLGKKIKAINYIADFVYFDKRTKQKVVEDVKGMKTPVYKLKKKMFEYHYKIEIKEI